MWDWLPLCGFCGGSIIATKYVITAAHCLYHEGFETMKTVDEIAVRIGEHDRKQEGEEKLPADFVNVKAFHKHPKWGLDKETSKLPIEAISVYDIAILELERELDLTKFTPVCLPKKSDLYRFDGKSARAVGWGDIGPYPFVKYPKIPREVDLTVMAHNDKRCSFENGTMLNPSMLCSGIDQPDTATCGVSDALNTNFTNF